MDRESKTSLRQIAALLLLFIFSAACTGSHDYSPKPRGYYRLILPAKSYRPYKGVCPFTFMYPKYAVIDTDKTSRKSNKLINMQSLLNLKFPQFNGTLHLSYESITSPKVFNELIEDAHSFAFKHTVKATSIDEGVISYPGQKVYGVYYTIEGNAASSVQFYLTDSTRNYIRGALYFNTEPRLDSIQPVLTFVKQDVNVLIRTFRWK